MTTASELHTQHRTVTWAPRRTAEELLALKRAQGVTVSVVLPARNEEHTVAGVVTPLLRALVHDVPLVDELLVLDSLSTDGTAAAARRAGVRCVAAADALPAVAPLPGKGEAMWRSLFVTSGDLLVFVDADLLDAGPHYVTGLLEPLLVDPATVLVKGFYERPLVTGDGVVPGGGGRVTELVARPLLNLYWPELAGVVQPLAGETAARRTLLEQLPFPQGYGVEMGLLLDTAARCGPDAIAQVDLGRRVHRHQPVAALGLMSAEIAATAMRRLDREPRGTTVRQFTLEAPGDLHTAVHPLGLAERPPAASTPGYSAGRPPGGQTVVRERPLRVLVDAGPWLPVPPTGYGGLENVVATLVPALRDLGVQVCLAAAAGSTLDCDDRVPDGPPAFGLLGRGYPVVAGHVLAHARRVQRYLRSHPEVDLVHSHVEGVGPALLADADQGPPVLHTLHWDPNRMAPLYAELADSTRLFVNAVSARHESQLPPVLRERSLGAVLLGTPAAPQAPDPGPHAPALVLGRVTEVKGQHVAVQACRRAGIALVLAGPVGAHLGSEPPAADDPHPDTRYWFEQVQPGLDARRHWVGSVSGPAKQRLLAGARCLLMPITWEEPGATVVVEALAAGTPVVGLRRGVLPELIEHGVTGLLTDDPDELPALLHQVAALDRGACRRAWAQRFTPERMAGDYLRLYTEVLTRTGRTRAGTR